MPPTAAGLELAQTETMPATQCHRSAAAPAQAGPPQSGRDVPIFEIADFGVVGDLFGVAPQLADEIAERKS